MDDTARKQNLYTTTPNAWENNGYTDDVDYSGLVANQPGQKHIYQPLGQRGGSASTQHNPYERCSSAKSISRLSMTFGHEAGTDNVKPESLTDTLKHAKYLTEDEDQYAEIPIKGKTSKKKICVAVLCTLLVAVIILAIAIAVPLALSKENNSENSGNAPSSERFGSDQDTTETMNNKMHDTTLKSGWRHTTVSDIGTDNPGNTLNTDAFEPTHSHEVSVIGETTDTVPIQMEDTSTDLTTDTLTDAFADSTPTTESTTKSPAITIPSIETSTVKYEIETRDDYSIEKAGTWGSWSEYTDCSRTCDGGQKTRKRVCESGNECVGFGIQLETCFQTTCPPEVTYGTWATWSGWEPCSLSCGSGVMTRLRECVKSSQTMLDCVGNQTQSTGCNQHDCPDCSLSCKEGTLSPDCTLCVCSNTFSGQVFGEGGVTLGNVSISPSTNPQKILYTTMDDGKFTLTQQCLENLFLLSRPGYIPAVIDGGNINGKQILEKTEPLIIVKNPKSKMRLVGESLTLCCEATGNPLPEYYEWFKDGQVLTTVAATAATDLVIENVNIGDSGTYTCRASNSYYAIKSSDATVNVQGSKDDFCPTIPSLKERPLPEGCFLNGESVFDEGYCPPSLCRGGVADTGQCKDSEKYCCGATSFSRLNIPCVANTTMTVLIVTACGCTRCQDHSVTISGIATGVDGDALLLGDIIYNGTVIGSTSITGTFILTLETEADRIPLTFKDSLFRKFVDTVYVVTVDEEHTGATYISVKMIEGYTVTVDSSEASELALVSQETGESIANISLPENSFYTEDGELYTGSVEITLAVVDVSGNNSQLAAPGDFTTISDEGESQQLDSTGMLAFRAADENGNPLTVPGDISLYLTGNQIGNITDESGSTTLEFWRLNSKTGNWEFESDISEVPTSTRKKRQTLPWGQRWFQATIRGMNVDVSWFNFDYVRTNMCYSKIRLFTSDKEQSQLTGAQVGVIVTDRGVTSLSRYRARTDYNSGSTGYCIAHLCKNRNSASRGFKAKYFADLNGNELIPAFKGSYSSSVFSDIGYYVTDDDNDAIPDINLININRADVNVGNKDGPFYNWEGWKGWRYSAVCSQAPVTHNFFKFYQSVCEYTYTPYPYQEPDDLLDVTDCPPQNHLAWYSPAMQTSSESFKINYQVCVVKIKVVTKSVSKLKFRAHSQVSQANKSKYQAIGSEYGLRDQCKGINEHSICVEIKNPSRVACNPWLDYFNTEQIDVDVVISSISDPRFIVTGLAQEFQSGNALLNPGNTSVSLNIVPNSQGTLYGIYCAAHEFQAEAFKEANKRCRSEDISGTLTGVADNFPAVTFTDTCTFKADVIFFVDTSTSMNLNLNAVKSMLKEFVDTSPIGQDLFRVALVTLTTTSTVLWNLDSPTSYTVASLDASIDSITTSTTINTPAFVFNHISTSILGSSADRSDAKNVVVFISDGDEPSTGLSTAAGTVNGQGMVIAVGTSTSAADKLRPHINNAHFLTPSYHTTLIEAIEEYICG